MPIRPLLVLLLCALTAGTAGNLGCGSSSEGDDITKTCNIIVKQCGGEAKGFGFDECKEKMRENNGACLQCILALDKPCALDGSDPNYVKLCHKANTGCDLR